MGKLNIAHHKSYHPYRRDNIEKVRKDEEEARLQEAKEEGRMMLADAEARIDTLRQRAGILDDSKEKKKKRRKDDDDMKQITASGSGSMQAALPTTNGHINLFEDLEHNTLSAAINTKKVAVSETEKGVPFAPSAKDLKPWYSEGSSSKEEAPLDDKRKRDETRKSKHDPLYSITKQLASRSPPSRPIPKPRNPTWSDKPPEVGARLSRESIERERALELIRRKQREMQGNATPSTVYDDSGYGDVYNRREVEEAHRFRERRCDDSSRDYRNSNHRPRR